MLPCNPLLCLALSHPGPSPYRAIIKMSGIVRSQQRRVRAAESLADQKLEVAQCGVEPKGHLLVYVHPILYCDAAVWLAL